MPPPPHLQAAKLPASPTAKRVRASSPTSPLRPLGPSDSLAAFHGSSPSSIDVGALVGAGGVAARRTRRTRRTHTLSLEAAALRCLCLCFLFFWGPPPLTRTLGLLLH